MKYTIEVTGIEECINTLKKIPKLIKSKKFKQYIGENCVNIINKLAKERLIISNEYVLENKIDILDNGVLIHNDVKNQNGTYYGLIIEYGSGTKAELDKAGRIGTTKSFVESGFEYWFVPEDIAPKLADYSFKTIITENGETLYMVYGQNPKHIYTDAAEEIANKLEEWTHTYIEENLDEILRS